ncbi:hypothetical protein ACP4OV_020237 [Aristida adscensionis]
MVSFKENKDGICDRRCHRRRKKHLTAGSGAGAVTFIHCGGQLPPRLLRQHWHPRDMLQHGLLPYADSFHGSLARVARAGAGAAVARQRGLMDELARLMLRGTGAGRAADMTLVDCYNGLEAKDHGSNEMLSHLDRLVAGVGSKQEFDEHVRSAGDWLSISQSLTVMCVDWFNILGEAVVSSPVVKEVIDGSNDLVSYMQMGINLTFSIKF